VTGGAGFIGSHLAAGLVEEGQQVRILDNFSSGTRRNLEGMPVEIFEGDIRDHDIVQKAMSGIDWVFHQAGYISAPKSVDQPIECYSINVSGTINILEAARNERVSSVVLASSAAIYGEVTQPASESQEAAPLTPYAASKLAMEQAAKLYHELYGLATVCLRYFNVYGPRQDPDSPYAAAIPLFIEAYDRDQTPVIYGDGKQSRDFVFVEDVFSANRSAAERVEASGEVINIAGGSSVTILSLLDEIASFFPGGKQPNFVDARPGDPKYSQADISKAQRLLGYRPRTGLEQGLGATVQWFRSQQTA
jgi:nucleoside-diphosphate-sugar epimerase